MLLIAFKAFNQIPQINIFNSLRTYTHTHTLQNLRLNLNTVALPHHYRIKIIIHYFIIYLSTV